MDGSRFGSPDGLPPDGLDGIIVCTFDCVADGVSDCACEGASDGDESDCTSVGVKVLADTLSEGELKGWVDGTFDLCMDG